MTSTREPGRGGEQVADQRRGRQHLLEVVEHQEQVPVAEVPRHAVGQRPVARLPHAEGLRDRRGDEGGVADRGEGDEDDAVGEVAAQLLRDPQGEARLADAAGTGQGQEADAVAAQQVAHGGDLGVPTDEGREGDRQGRGVHGAHRLRRVETRRHRWLYPTPSGDGVKRAARKRRRSRRPRSHLPLPPRLEAVSHLPYSSGSARHEAPERTTHRMPASTIRWSWRGRPVAGLCGGSIDATRCHSASVSSASAAFAGGGAARASGRVAWPSARRAAWQRAATA